MLQELMIKPGEIEFNEVEYPKIKKGHVIVKMRRLGICGSDIHVYHGKHPFTSYPVTQGHEVSGEVYEIGEGVEGLELGQKVIIETQVVCGECYPCKHGKYNLCENLKVMGFQTVGAASEYYMVESSRITPIPDNMSFEEGAMMEPLAVAVHSCNRYGDVKGADVAVLGCGPIGILIAQVCKAKGAKRVMVTDISDMRLKLAKDCGIDFAVNTKNEDFEKSLIENFGPDKVDVIYDCAGTNTTINDAIKYSRKGSKIILVAVFDGMATVDLAVLNDKELELNSSMMYRHEDFLEAIKLTSEKKVSLKPLMSKHFAFRDFKKAYEYIDANREGTMKVFIDIDK